MKNWILILLLAFAAYFLAGCELLDRILPPTPCENCCDGLCIPLGDMTDELQDLLDGLEL